MIFDYVKDWGPTGVLALAVILVLTGRLQWRRTLDSEITLLKESWEDRIKARTAETERVVLAFDKINEANEHLIAALRGDKQALLDSLTGAIANTKNLLVQQDELLELSRTATPLILALQRGAVPNVRSGEDHQRREQDNPVVD